MPHAIKQIKNTTAPRPAGGAFLVTGTAPSHVFTPEGRQPEADLVGQTMEEFIRQEVAPLTDRLEIQEPGLTASLVKRAGALGLLAAGLPAAYGGLDLPKTTVALLAERSGIDLSTAITMGVHAGVGALPVLLFGTEEQRRRWLPRIATGGSIAAFAISEGNSGSDALAAKARAVSDGHGGYVLDGTKLWVTNGGFADIFTVFAQIPDVGFTAFLVERDTAGVSFSAEERKMGLRGSSTRRLFLNKVRVDASAIIGEPGAGHRPALYALNAGRFNIGAIALGGAKEALRMSVKYATQRRQSGKSIAEFGLIQAKLAEMAARIFALESMVYRAAGCWDSFLELGRTPAETYEEYAIECAVLKFYGTEVLGFAADETLQIHGGFGYHEDYPVARLYRDARVFRIFEGTNEINRLTVVDQVRRRIERGRLTWSDGDRSLLRPSDTVRRLVGLLYLHQPPGAPWEQAAAGAWADIAAALYAIESCEIRTGKMADADGSDFAKMLADLVVEREIGRVADGARVVVSNVNEDVPDDLRGLLRALSERPLVDVARCCRMVAETVCEAGGYSW